MASPLVYSDKGWRQSTRTSASTILFIKLLCTAGQGDEKGKVVGIFRSLGALSRALGPVIACTGL